ncbi:MAG: hypothetical protein LiPW15_429 [Parcubacteria group bacterium LiPW_15]|nr:MAG: hypothetical protein LiPW15_429 [Parcubacteria group bacterium LiPW_15]
MHQAEKFRQEQEPRIDLLKENLRVSFEIAPEAVEYLPAISLGDGRSGRERFGVLLGAKQVNPDGSVHLQIKGVYQETAEDGHRTYEEEIDNVAYSLALIKKQVEKIQRDTPQHKEFGFLGDVHTHPGRAMPLYPSEEDLLSVIRAYESGTLSSAEPYVFGIGVRHPGGEMEYNFYRIVRTGSESGYGYKLLDE